MNFIINCDNVRDVFSYTRYFANCLYSLVTRLCSEPVARHYTMYLEVGWRLSYYYRYGCDIGVLGTLKLLIIIFPIVRL